MAKATPGINAFNAGELSPLLDSRTDKDWYRSGCKKLENFIPLVQGPAMRDPGTKFVSEIASSSNRSWLGVFQFSSIEAYVLEISDNCIRLFQDRGAIIPPTYDAGTVYDVGQFIVGPSGGQYMKIVASAAGIAPPNAIYWVATGLSIDPITIPTPWDVTVLTGNDGECALRIAQTGDVLYIVHSSGDIAPVKISRYSDSRWVLQRVDYAYNWQQWDSVYGGPFQDQNIDRSLMVYADVTSDQEPGSLIDIVAGSGAFFDATDIYSLFYIEQKSLDGIKMWEPAKAVVVGDVRRSYGKNYKAVASGTTGAVPPIHSEGSIYDGNAGVQWTFEDTGYGDVTIRSVNSTITKTITGAADNGSGRVRITAVGHGFKTGYPITISGVTGTTEANGTWRITVISADTFDLPETFFTNAYVSGGTAVLPTGCIATCKINSRVPDGACGYANNTHRWARGAFSYRNGWPEQVCFFRERLTFTRGQTVYGSVVGDFENFAKKNESGQVTVEQAYISTIVSDQSDKIKWISPAPAGMLIGTDGAELVLSELTSSSPFGPGNIRVDPKTSHGSRAIQPAKIGDEAIFVQRSGKKIRSFSLGIDGYKSLDLSVRNDQITLGGIIDMIWQKEPWQVLWCVTATGKLIGLTYNSEQEVIGWHSHTLGGVFGSGDAFVEAVQCIPSPTNDRDDLYLIVKRTINGATKRYIEYFVPEFQTGDAVTSPFYVRCGVTYNGAPATTVSGLTHLNGQTVAVLADGSPHANCVVTSGSITLTRSASIIHAGLPYTSTLQTMRLEAGSVIGSAQGKIKRVAHAIIRFFNTVGAKVGPMVTNLDTIEFRLATDIMGSPIPIRSMDKKVPWPGGYETDGHLVIVQDLPLPMTVVGVFPSVDTQDG